MRADELNDHLRQLRRRPLFERDPSCGVDITGDAITRLLPHRSPFLFVDRITHVDLGASRLAGSRVVDLDDPAFAGHFPGRPVYPGVLQMEMMGQHGLTLLALMELGSTVVPVDAVPRDIRALKVHHAVFAREVVPADQLAILVEILDANTYTAIAAGQILCREEICSFGVMEMYFAG
jgi:3-hydroxymyristoyl/3-hydroxydecanoyl-(acyl carrier protein) dehydratase